MIKTVEINEKEKIIEEMCRGCYRSFRGVCEVISEPGYIYQLRGECWAWVDYDRAMEIEEEIEQNGGESQDIADV